MKRPDDFEKRREHLKDLTEEQLKERFWELAYKIVEAMLEMGYKYTTPAIERSVLLRMGFSSVEVKPIVEGVMKKGLMAILEKQVNILEQKMDLYHLPLPDRPPKSVKFFLTGNVVNDEYVYHKLFKGIQNSIDGLVKSVVSFVYNDDLRRLFFEFLQKELEVYDDLCKYGKLKGWMRNPPLIPANGG